MTLAVGTVEALYPAERVLSLVCGESVSGTVAQFCRMFVFSAAWNDHKAVSFLTFYYSKLVFKCDSPARFNS